MVDSTKLNEASDHIDNAIGALRAHSAKMSSDKDYTTQQCVGVMTMAINLEQKQVEIKKLATPNPPQTVRRDQSIPTNQAVA